MSLITGNVSSLTEDILGSGAQAVSLCITMAGSICLWNGIMEVGIKSGLVDWISDKITPFSSILFPGVDKNSIAIKYLNLNLISNFLGLSAPATPAGIKGMIELNKLNKSSTIASDAMCNFIIINISSIQLIPINIIAYRNAYGSVHPTSIIFPSIVATSVSTIAALVFIFIMRRFSHAN